jgi:hypothetical protein
LNSAVASLRVVEVELGTSKNRSSRLCVELRHWFRISGACDPSAINPYIASMVWRVRGQPLKFSSVVYSSVSDDRRHTAPSGPRWTHELRHDGYRLQIHMRDGRVRLYTMNGADWSKRYPLIIKDATSIASYRSGKSKAWIKVKKSNAPAATRAVDGTF